MRVGRVLVLGRLMDFVPWAPFLVAARVTITCGRTRGSGADGVRRVAHTYGMCALAAECGTRFEMLVHSIRHRLVSGFLRDARSSGIFPAKPRRVRLSSVISCRQAVRVEERPGVFQNHESYEVS